MSPLVDSQEEDERKSVLNCEMDDFSCSAISLSDL